MKTFQEYIGWLRNLQFVLDSPEIEEKRRLASKRDLCFYAVTSGLPLHPSDSNLMLGLNLDFKTTINELNKLGIKIKEEKGQKPSRDWNSWWENRKVTAYDWRRQTDTRAGGYIWSDPAEVSFSYSDQQVVTTPLGLEIDKPSVLIRNKIFSSLGKIDGSFHVQTLVTTHLGCERRRDAEDFMLNILEYLVRTKVSAFYGQYKSADNYVINK